MEYPLNSTQREYMPPNEPWQELEASSAEAGYLSYYFSDDMSRYAVREVTRPNDNKSDPNIETMTYGLFSTCERSMRAGVVKNKRPHIFFITRQEGERWLSGYYHVKWYAEGSPVFTYLKHGKVQDDYILCADSIRFIDPPIRLAELAERFDDEFYTKRFRTYKKTNQVQTEELLKLIYDKKDMTQRYIDETKRLERVNCRFHGHRYTNWEQSEEFSWELAKDYILADSKLDIEEVKERFKSISSEDVDWWECLDCGHEIESQRPLKRCPKCNAIGTQVPLIE